VERGKPSSDRIGEIALLRFKNSERTAQYFSRFFFHRAPMLGGLHPEPGLGLFIESANG